MTKVRSVITGALRKLGIVGGTGRREPSLTEYFDSLVIFASMYRSLITFGTLGRLRDVVPRGDYVSGENQRVYRVFNEAQSILLPELVSDCGACGYVGCSDYVAPETNAPPIPSYDYGRKPYGYHEIADRRPVRDGAVVTIVDRMSGEMIEAIYDGQVKSWITINDLDLDDLDESDPYSLQRLQDALDQPAPLSHRDRNGLTALLATLLADDFGTEVPQNVALQAAQFKQALTGNYSTYKRDDI